MNVLDVDLYQFELVYRICFRKVVQKKEKGVELIVLTPCRDYPSDCVNRKLRDFSRSFLFIY